MKALFTNGTYIEDESITVMGYKIYGTPWIPKQFQKAFPDKNIRDLYKSIPSDTDILMTHMPAYGITYSIS